MDAIMSVCTTLGVVVLGGLVAVVAATVLDVVEWAWKRGQYPPPCVSAEEMEQCVADALRLFESPTREQIPWRDRAAVNAQFAAIVEGAGRE